MATELKERIVVSDETGFAVWTRHEYESYIKGCAIAGAAPAYWIVTHFDEDEKLLSPSTPLSVEEAAGTIDPKETLSRIIQNYIENTGRCVGPGCNHEEYILANEVGNIINDIVSELFTPSTPIPSDIVKQLEKANPYTPSTESDYYDDRNLGELIWNNCVSKLRELLQDQPVEQEKRDCKLPGFDETMDNLKNMTILSTPQSMKAIATKALQSYHSGNQTEKEEEKP